MAVIQVRGVPESTAQVLKDRALGAGVSLSEYLRTELERLAALPTPEEMRRRLESRRPVPGASGAAIIREERSRRG
jgi:hypothetical protein